MTMARWMLALACLAVAVACGAGPSTDGGPPPGDGKILIDWTLGGQPPSTASCAGADHLLLTLDDGVQRITISPITCSLTRFRYDGLSRGSATLRLDALDAAGCRIATGAAAITIGATVPSVPSPTVALSAIVPCR